MTPAPLRILIADDERPARFGMAKALGQPAYEILQVEDGQAALESLRQGAIDLVFLDLNMPRLDGQGVLRALSGEPCRAEIVVITANDSVAAAVECMRLGAADYITKPYEVERLRGIARRVAHRRELERRIEDLQSDLQGRYVCGALVGASAAMRDLFTELKRAAQCELDVLICGETGTGKELIAREVHRQGPRASGPFVAVNTAAIADSLAESELFGHVRGAFTGAEADRRGVFEQADGGTLFLDEIGDMPLSAQAKILRALQERAIQPVGSSKTVAVDVRVITATHQDLAKAIEEGHFRKDLYYRIRGIELAVPPLRARREDILLLANYFLEQSARNGDAPRRLAAHAADRLLAHQWPGNVRELEQTVKAAAAMAEREEIAVVDLRLPRRDTSDDHDLDLATLVELPLTQAKAQLVADFEKRAITTALERHGGNISAAARQLGIHRQSLQQKLAQLGLDDWQKRP
ncbi:MAG: sigma-54-dependent Fis family transcriptional regulator [Planctomycetia bacterium]|nr:sigma-54-dependent Fis family transcriptional regulator [Planctomycetia bacterium]